MIRGLGFIQERKHRRVFGKLATAARSSSSLLLPERVDPVREPWITDQGRYNACTGHAGAQLFYTLTGVKVSPWMLWQFGLVRDGADPYEKLPNDGVRTSSVLASFRKHGACLLEEWDWDSEARFDPLELPPAVCRIEAQKRNLDVDQLFEGGSRMPLFATDALAHKRGVTISVEVDRGYDEAKTDPVGPVDGPIRGHHLISLIGCRRRGGAYEYLSPSSWSEGHGDSGLVWLTQERVSQSRFMAIAKGVS